MAGITLIDKRKSEGSGRSWKTTRRIPSPPFRGRGDERKRCPAPFSTPRSTSRRAGSPRPGAVEDHRLALIGGEAGRCLEVRRGAGEGGLGLDPRAPLAPSDAEDAAHPGGR